jgi:hypothetical protein
MLCDLQAKTNIIIFYYVNMFVFKCKIYPVSTTQLVKVDKMLHDMERCKEIVKEMNK